MLYINHCYSLTYLPSYRCTLLCNTGNDTDADVDADSSLPNPTVVTASRLLMTPLRCTELFSSSVSSICHQLHSTKTCEIYLQWFHVFICLLIVCLICLCIICSFSTLITASPSENWRRPPGRPRTTWMKTIQQDLRSNRLTISPWMRR